MIPGRTPARRGQSLIEFALILPILIFIIMFVIDLGRIVYYRSALYNSAREGARYGITNYSISHTGNVIIDTAGVESAARGMAIGMKAADLTVGSVVIGTLPTRPLKLEVTTTYRFRAVTPLVWEFLSSNPVVLRTKSTMNIEY